MNRDELYIYDKKTWDRSLLGEVQSGFNMSFVIDGTKDSFRCHVWSFNDIEIEPYTICWHKATNTWWVVSHDKVDRYQNDSGYIYDHDLELLGAIELLNARDLTDCGFNADTYTFQEFIGRLFRLSNWEYGLGAIEGNIDTSTKVNFIKTFENYTLLSALREFLDAYNYSAKLSFSTQVFTNKIVYAYLTIIPKTGDNTLDEHIDENFDDVRETKTMDKNSFGTCVVSNAENVISKVPKTFPSTGSVRCSAHEYIIKAENAIIRLPSKVFKANWLKLINTKAFVEASYSCGSQGPITQSPSNLSINISDYASYKVAIAYLLELIYSLDYSEYHDTPNQGAFYNPCKAALESQEEYIFEQLKLANTITLYDGINLTPVSNSSLIVTKGANMPYLVYADYYSRGDDGEPLVFCDKDTKNVLLKKWTAIQWERGSDEISGFEGFEPDTNRNATITIRNLLYTDLQKNVSLAAYGTSNSNESYVFFHFLNSYGELYIRIPTSGPFNIHFRNNAQWIVNYYPMSDIKIKVDNQSERNDIQLYNQNGKLTDNYALSKMLNSHAKEISGDTITKYGFYTNLEDIPEIGSLVYIGDDTYVINNISMTFTQNENTQYDFGYYIECEFTMSKNISVKSLMVNPNTNIRDYGIPQNYNVKRKQVYRDYYELAYTKYTSVDISYYLEAENVFNFGHFPNIDTDLVAVMKIDYDEQINGSTTYYYQLETTVYDLNKMFYIMLDFKDNNIIGYAGQNVYSGFVLSRLISGTTDVLNVPLSYVDSKGRFDKINILFMDNEELTLAYKSYLSDNGYSASYSISNYSTFIPSDIYNKCLFNEKIEISEFFYEKDALEVPVFEYGCQAADTDEVLIGDDIFRQHDSGDIYMYSFVEGYNLTQENVVATSEIIDLTEGVYTIYNSVEISYINDSSGKKIKIKKYESTDYHADISGFENINHLNITPTKDIAVFRHVKTPYGSEQKSVELLFIAKKVPTDAIDNNGDLIIYLNHYQLK